MKDKLKNFLIPFVLMMITNIGYYYLTATPNFGGELNPHMGILFISGIFFGPYGCLGAVIGNFICDILRGYTLDSAIASEIVSFLISYLAYKLWYTKRLDKYIITRPRLNNTSNLNYLFIIILECSILYSVLSINITEIFYPIKIGLDYHIGLQYFTNFMNFALLVSIICILICKYKDFSYKPEINPTKENKRKYEIIYLLIVILTITGIALEFTVLDYVSNIIITLLLIILIALYCRKPIKEVNTIDYESIPEKIMNYFVCLTLIVLVVDIIGLFTPIRNLNWNILYTIGSNQEYLIILLILDVFILLYFIPALVLLRYIEGKIIEPIRSFAKIESFIKKDEKIESEGILQIYSDYTSQDDEIGILSRSYSNLIKNNNEYIENLEKLEADKQKINAELNIAHKIQQATLPKQTIDNEYMKIEVYCRPTREVGGDFYDFYQINEDNTLIVIGDASGKGIPAALFTIIIQNSIKLLVKNNLNPSKVLYDVNNQICENNPALMFITLFLGIYNNKTHKLTYANAGHNPPIIKDDNNYKLLEVDAEIVLGIMEDYAYKNYEITLDDEIILYTDGITDAQNSSCELYGEERLIKYLNNSKDDEIITSLINDVDSFSKEEEQFDDMTLLRLKLKQ